MLGIRTQAQAVVLRARARRVGRVAIVMRAGAARVRVHAEEEHELAELGPLLRLGVPALQHQVVNVATTGSRAAQAVALPHLQVHPAVVPVLLAVY